MLDILTRNYNYRNKSARLYELARVYLPGGEDGLANESKVLTLGAYGGDMDFYAMKGAVEAILKDIRATDIHFEGPTGAPSDASLPPRPLRHRVEWQRLHRHLRPDPPPGGPELWRGRRALLRRALL